ncbi:response regulator [Pseudomonas sp. LRF_L74]|uniref:response regulator n=1 Tax=Pseudomonas sp. LRF_L74 TaxID=3369422 RepID=UPI003F62933D
MNTVVTVDEKSFRRILARNVVIPIATGALGVALFVGLITYLLNAISWVEHTDRVISLANETYRLGIDQQSGLRGYLVAGQPEYLEPYEAARSRIGPRIEELRGMVKDNSLQLDRLRTIEALLARWEDNAQEIIALRKAGQSLDERIRSGLGKQLMDSIRSQFDAFIASEQQLREQRTDKSSAIALFTISLYVLASLAFSCLLALFGRRELLSLSKAYGDILARQGRFTEQLQQQAWQREGQSQLAARIIGQLSAPAIGRATLNFLADYIDLAVGAFYARQDDGSLRRVADYGFSAEQHNSASADDPAGLLTQVLATQKPRVLQGLTTRYLKVNSGLGSDDPLTVMLSPTATEGEANGILELGFIGSLSQREQDFIESISMNLGMSLDAARYRKRLHDALTDTQQLNEELQVQQEELKSANEELEDQANLIRESQASLEVRQAELEQTNEQLNDYAQRLRLQRDELDQRNHSLAQARGDLEQKAEELQRASQYKSEFLANMSHELRTPLNSSLILSRMLADNQRGNLDPKQVKYAELIYSSGKDLLVLINDILDIAKVEAGRLEVRPANTNVRELLLGLESVFTPIARENALGFSLHIADGTPEHFFSDGQRVEQILKNLLSNAFKFTNQGSVELRVSPVEHGIAFAVNDTGIGIDTSQQELIFEAFRQLDSGISREFGGTGLGLSISRNLAQMLGGHLQVSSEPQRGSCFTLWLPLDYADEKAPAVPLAAPALPNPLAPLEPSTGASTPHFPDDRDKEDIHGRSVLAVEDEPRFAQILYDLAHELGYRCLIAGSASEGLELVKSQHPDAILLDMRLPDEPGLSLLQRLKENPHSRHIPVHVISTDDRTELALHLGAIGYAQKPTSREELIQVFARLEARLEQRVGRILVVEGNASERTGISELVNDEGIDVTAVEGGEQALEQLRQRSFDCIVIGLHLQDMTGSELLNRMARDIEEPRPPVIVYSTRILSRSEEEELLHHSRSIIIKGARSPERLLDEVTLFLHKVESSFSDDRQRMLQSVRNRDKVFENRLVMVVDDDVRNVYALISALDAKGAKVISARNGQEALEKLEKNPGIELVLMDVMMPVMDGFEATRRIRQTPRWSKLPIIAVTAKAMKDDQDQCMEAGASDYLAKPIDLDRLFSLIRVWLPKRDHP